MAYIGIHGIFTASWPLRAAPPPGADTSKNTRKERETRPLERASSYWSSGRVIPHDCAPRALREKVDTSYMITAGFKITLQIIFSVNRE
jgi:hypothetical protein